MLSREQIESYLAKSGLPLPDKEQLDEIILSANGSLGYALDLLDKSKSEAVIKDRERAKEFAGKLLLNDATTVIMLNSMFNMTRERLKEIFSLSLVALRDLAVVKRAKSAPLCFFTSSKEASVMASPHSVQKILYTYNKISEGIDSLGSNSNVPSTLISLITDSKKKGN